MLFSPSFLRAGCCAAAFQMVTSFSSIAMTGGEEVRGLKPAAPMVHLDKTDPSYRSAKSLLGREPTADQVAAYAELDALFKGNMSGPRQDQFANYLAAKAAGVTTIKNKSDLYDYQVTKNLLGIDPTQKQFEAFGELQVLLKKDTSSPKKDQFTTYLAAKDAGITIKNEADFKEYQSAKKILGVDPTATQFSAYNTLQKKNTYRSPTKAEIEEQVKKGSESANLL